MTEQRGSGYNAAMRALAEAIIDIGWLDANQEEEYYLRFQQPGEFVGARQPGDESFSGLVLVRFCPHAPGICRRQLEERPFQCWPRVASNTAAPDDAEWFTRHPEAEFRVRRPFAYEHPGPREAEFKIYRIVISRDASVLPITVSVPCEGGDAGEV